MAKKGNFHQPIFHGLGFFGITARCIQENFCQDPTDFLTFTTRFVGHTFPGETLAISAWREKDTVIFTVKTKERGKPVIQGFATLRA
jgi:multifunctional beta-oxidation protein